MIVAKVDVSTTKERPAEIAMRSIYPQPPASNAIPATTPVMGEAEAKKAADFWLNIRGYFCL
jgi:hypothetical protein